MRAGDGRSGGVPWIWLALVVLAYGGLWVWRLTTAAVDTGVLSRTWAALVPAGVLGATLTGATGTSTGLVTIPVFEWLQEAGTLRLGFGRDMASQFVIQAFAGAVGMGFWVSWLYGRRDDHREQVVEVQDFLGIVFTTVCFSIPALIVTQLAGPWSDRSLLAAFYIVMLVLGVIFWIFVWSFQTSDGSRFTVAHGDLYVAMVIGCLGGLLTGLFSIGVGEFLGIYMIARRFPLAVSIAAAATTSFITVLAGLWYGVATGRVVWELVLLVAPGAAIGTGVAFGLAMWLGPLLLRALMAAWLVGISLLMIVRTLV